MCCRLQSLLCVAYKHIPLAINIIVAPWLRCTFSIFSILCTYIWLAYEGRSVSFCNKVQYSVSLYFVTSLTSIHINELGVNICSTISVLNFDDPLFVFRVLIEGVKYYASEPRMLGRTFLRLVSKLLCDKDVLLIYSWVSGLVSRPRFEVHIEKPKMFLCGNLKRNLIVH